MANKRKITIPDAPPAHKALMASGSSYPQGSGVAAAATETFPAPQDMGNGLGSHQPKKVQNAIEEGQNKIGKEPPKSNPEHSDNNAPRVMKDPVIIVVVLMVCMVLAWAFLSQSSMFDNRSDPTAAQHSDVHELPVQPPKALDQSVPPSSLPTGPVSRVVADDPGMTNPTRIEEEKSPARSPSPEISALPPQSLSEVPRPMHDEPQKVQPVEASPPSPVIAQLKVINVERNDTLSVRKLPSMSSPRIGRIPANATGLGLLDLEGRKNGRDTWYRIWWNGKVGWVNGSFVDYQ
jgi:hypothetical protein